MNISDEAVRAAWAGLDASDWEYHSTDLFPEPGDEAMRAALAAALPHLQAHFDMWCNVQQEAAEAQRDNALARIKELEECGTCDSGRCFNGYDESPQGAWSPCPDCKDGRIRELEDCVRILARNGEVLCDYLTGRQLTKAAADPRIQEAPEANVPSGDDRHEQEDSFPEPQWGDYQ